MKAGYAPPPTQRDKEQSVVHHQNSLAYNLAHARAHATEALSHAEALQDRLAVKPNFRTHYDRLGREGGESAHVQRAERTERPVIKRLGLAHGEAPERRLARGGRR